MKTNINDNDNIYEIHKNIKLPELNDILIHNDNKDRINKNSIPLDDAENYAYRNPKKENH